MCMCVYTRRANPRTEPSGILGRDEVIGYGVGVLGDSGAGVAVARGCHSRHLILHSHRGRLHARQPAYTRRNPAIVARQ